MSRLIRHVSFLLAVLAIGVTIVGKVQAQLDTDVAGTVTRLQGLAVAMQDALPRPLQEGDKILVGDVISTGKGARLEMKMLDDAVMKLGEKTVFVVVEYLVQNPQPSGALRLLEGAFSATSGKMMQVAGAQFTMSTETATIGIRGTTFWGGKIDGSFGIALLDGKGIYVETKAGRVDISTVGEGTSVSGADTAPTAPRAWSAEKTARALATVEFSK